MTGPLSNSESTAHAGAFHDGWRRAAVFALLVTLAAGGWIALETAFHYGGHLSGMFYTGTKSTLPAELDGAHTYRVADDIGYDGQFYRIIAHDPLLQRGFLVHVDNPRLRWRRIGVPGLAALLAVGNDSLIDPLYVAIELAFVFAGSFWLARFAERHGAGPGWAWAFLLIPAVAVSVDRMTVDLPLAALCIGFAYFATQGEENRARWPLYAVLCAAPLVRETGMILVAGWALYSLLGKRWMESARAVAYGVPAVAWWFYVHLHTPPDATEWLSQFPYSGLLVRTFHGIDAPTGTLGLHVAAAFEQLSVVGFWFALALVAYLAYRRRLGPLELTAMVFALFAGTLGKFDIWSSVYAAGRTMSPLLILLALQRFPRHRAVYLFPLVLVLPRIVQEYYAQFKGILAGM